MNCDTDCQHCKRGKLLFWGSGLTGIFALLCGIYWFTNSIFITIFYCLISTSFWIIHGMTLILMLESKKLKISKEAKNAER